MKRTLIILLALFLINSSIWAQKPKAKSTTKKEPAQLSKAEKMGYQRTNKYYGPGTYYCYAPGKPINKMADNGITALRDLTGLMQDDFNTELTKQGFVEVAKNDVKKWFNENKSKDKKFYYAPDKSYILLSELEDLYNSPVMSEGQYAFATRGMIKYVLLPVADSLKVMEAIYQYLRDLNEMKVILGSYGSTFKNANPKIYPIQKAGTSGWTSGRAGSFVLIMVDGKPKILWERNEDIIRRNLGKPELKVEILGQETDFFYGLTIKLMKEGYVLTYQVLAGNISNLEPGTTWPQFYPTKVKEYQMGVKGDKDAVNLYKKAPFPPVLEDLNKFLHIQ